MLIRILLTVLLFASSTSLAGCNGNNPDPDTAPNGSEDAADIDEANEEEGQPMSDTGQTPP